MKAVSALTAAFRLVEIRRCSGVRVGIDCGWTPEEAPYTDMLDALMKMSYTFRDDTVTELDGTQLIFTNQGKLVATRYMIYQITSKARLKLVSSTITLWLFN